MVRLISLLGLICVVAACNFFAAPAEPAPSTLTPPTVAVQPLELKVVERRWLIFETERTFTPVSYVHANIVPDQEYISGQVRACGRSIFDCEGEFTPKDFALTERRLTVYRPSACPPSTERISSEEAGISVWYTFDGQDRVVISPVVQDARETNQGTLLRILRLPPCRPTNEVAPTDPSSI